MSENAPETQDPLEPRRRGGADDTPVSTTIGPWQILRTLGEGGFGVVSLAERKNPAQQAAIKLIKPGMDSRKILARFEAERQALALLSHPNIARLYEAGIHDGRPYFAMEYIPGLPITDYAERHKLTITQRLQLFQQVCAAVQHAHLKAIIHRDISARNVLVTEIDGQPTAKVIDFGIAKAIGVALTDQTIDTGAGNIIGNYAYMSPEQASGDADIDARTDVYSLGVLLYELLTGQRPFDNATIHKAGDLGIRKLIVETDPPRPSSNTTLSQELTRLLRRELEWIPLKALRKDRVRRYQTPTEFADDIQNYLDRKPLSAGPESRVYRLKKFSNRNRGPLAVAATAVLLTVGATAFYIHNIRAEQARTTAALARADAEAAEKEKQRAEATRQRDEAANQRDEARKQTAIAEAVAKFQTDMLASADPNKQLGDKVTVVQAMTAATKELDEGKLKDQPLVEASIRGTIGRTFDELGVYDKAEPALKSALAIRREQLPPTHRDITTAASDLAVFLFYQNRLAEAEPLFREALEIHRKTLPPGDPAIAAKLDQLALVLQNQNKIAEAEQLFREALALRRASLRPGDPEIANTLINLASLLDRINKSAEAEPLFREALEMQRKSLPPGHPELAFGITRLAILLQGQNKLSEAEPLFREALDIRRKALPETHPGVGYSVGALAGLLQDQGKLEEAEALYRQALSIRRASLPPEHPNIGINLNNLGDVLRELKRPVEAEPLIRESIAILRKARPAGHPDIAAGLTNLARILQDQQRFEEAEAISREALDTWRKAVPPGHPRIATCLHNLGNVLQSREKFPEAEEALREAVAINRKSLPPDHPSLLATTLSLASVLQILNKNDEASPFYAEVLAHREKTFGPTDPRTCTIALYLAQTLDASNRKVEADALRQKYRLGDPATRPAPQSRPATMP